MSAAPPRAVAPEGPLGAVEHLRALCHLGPPLEVRWSRSSLFVV